MTKPFSLDELNARLRALGRRRAGIANPVLTHNDLRLDPAGHTLSRNGEPISLSMKEFAILQRLMENRGRILSRSQLEESLYSWDSGVESNAVEVHIHHLRKKLGREVIRTVRGLGYCLNTQQP
ncbi:MAG: hypothetical protein C3L25_06215 [Candidatus Sedimenticola endophacoides]|nr:MAG: hypothetical protein C3L26_06180 [Candidatus Sedimenticola endophacoides]PUE03898.1 MAG: hypothetical protein C3L25_06215 [Candidatus Sedimenticola endophacoides]